MLRREENTNQSHQVPVLFSPLPVSSVVKGAKDNSDLTVPLVGLLFPISVSDIH